MSYPDPIPITHPISSSPVFSLQRSSSLTPFPLQSLPPASVSASTPASSNPRKRHHEGPLPSRQICPPPSGLPGLSGLILFFLSFVLLFRLVGPPIPHLNPPSHLLLVPCVDPIPDSGLLVLLLFFQLCLIPLAIHKHTPFTPIGHPRLGQISPGQMYLRP